MMKRRYAALLACATLAAACSQGDSNTVPAEDTSAEMDGAETAEPKPQAASDFEDTDYADTANWLCHPDAADDACDTDLSYTIVNADGSMDVQGFEAAANPQIDCFYIYPTVSNDETGNSDLDAGPEELRVVESQFARFAETCRLYAPLYRQMTVPELRRRMMGMAMTASDEMRWADIQGAWADYVDNHNDGRGVVLIGHSQGSDMVDRLVRETIIGSDMEDQIVSIIPTGWTLYVDAATGDFGPYETCTVEGQTGCILGYVSFRDTVPPPQASLFGVTNPDGQRALCVNPAELSGDDGMLDARLAAGGWFGEAPADFANGEGVDTPYAALPGLLSAECVEAANHTYLEITVNADPDDPRTDDIQGDLIGPAGVMADWGLHLIDMHAAMGNLVDIVAAQSETWVAAEAAED
ncbi:MAG: DUF3089 domain-containing protein [Henriciella sp.]|uniref:DUF3089 domain-containing protein n=1 Tax=Henriciella sp. TaxID=1968823 RepID=UPI003C77899A